METKNLIFHNVLVS